MRKAEQPMWVPATATDCLLTTGVLVDKAISPIFIVG